MILSTLAALATLSTSTLWSATSMVWRSREPSTWTRGSSKTTALIWWKEADLTYAPGRRLLPKCRRSVKYIRRANLAEIPARVGGEGVPAAPAAPPRPHLLGKG